MVEFEPPLAVEKLNRLLRVNHGVEELTKGIFSESYV